jgi:hypothetical protein
MTDYINRLNTGHYSLTHIKLYLSLAADGLENGFLTFLSYNADISELVIPPLKPNFKAFTPFSLYSASAENKFTTLYNTCTCEKCTERKNR